MFTCPDCNKELKSYRAFNAHKITHKQGPRYSVTRQKPKGTFECINCSKIKTVSKTTQNRFCSNECSAEYTWIQSKTKIEGGEALSFQTMRKYLLEVRGSCEGCGITDTYNGKPISLQCDHIDGDNDNHNLNNLRLLCPNCHSQTLTWCARNKKDTKRNNYLRNYKAGLAQR